MDHQYLIVREAFLLTLDAVIIQISEHQVNSRGGVKRVKIEQAIDQRSLAEPFAFLFLNMANYLLCRMGVDGAGVRDTHNYAGE